MFDSLQPHGLQYTRFFCVPPSPRVCPDSCPLSPWYYLTISSFCLLLLLPSIFPSIRVFSNESALLNRWPKYWSFSFSISPSNEYSRLISFRTNCCELFAVQGTLKSTWSGSPAEAVRDSGSLKDKWQETFLGQPEQADVCACKEYLEELPGHPPEQVTVLERPTVSTR